MPFPSVTSGAVTSMPSLTRSGRPSASLASSPPSGCTWTALRVSSAMLMVVRTLALQTRGSEALPQTFETPEAEAAPEAPPPCAAADPAGARRRRVRLRAGDGPRRRDPAARPGALPPGEEQLHLREQRANGAGRPARVGEPTGRVLGPDRARHEAGDRGRRGPPVLRAPRHRPARDRPRGLGRHPAREGGRRRLDHHAAVREERVRAERALDFAQAEGSGPLLAARAALEERPDPDRLPEHHLLRERCLWNRAGRTRVFRALGGHADPPGSGPPRGHSFRSIAL